MILCRGTVRHSRPEPLGLHNRPSTIPSSGRPRSRNTAQSQALKQNASTKDATNIYDVPLWAVCCLLLARLLPAAVYWLQPLMFAGVPDTFLSKDRVRGGLDGRGEVSGGDLGEPWGSWEFFGDPRWGSRSSLWGPRGVPGGGGWLSGSLGRPWEYNII